MENRQKELIQMINEYLILMPNASKYNICRQQETKKILEYLINHNDDKDSKLLKKELLVHYRDSITKWDGVTHEPEDLPFQLLILEVQIELRALKARLQAQSSQANNEFQLEGC